MDEKDKMLQYIKNMKILIENLELEMNHLLYIIYEQDKIIQNMQIEKKYFEK